MAKAWRKGSFKGEKGKQKFHSGRGGGAVGFEKRAGGEWEWSKGKKECFL